MTVRDFARTASTWGKGALALSLFAAQLMFAAEPESAKPQTEDQAAAEEIVIPKSVFIDDPKRGRDPFFPKSVRRSGPQPAMAPASDQTSTAAPVPVAKPQLPSRHLVLRAISRTGSRTVAWLSGNGILEEFLENTEKSVRTPDGPLKVRCLQILERSVIISVEGEPDRQELKLKGGS
jgi:hypothetical protein